MIKPLRFLPLVLISLLAAPAFGQGIIIPERPDVRGMPFWVRDVKVSAYITDGVCETAVEQTFVNNTDREQEGTYLFPLPEGASVTSFTLKAGDKVLEGKLMTKDEARRIYESIVRRRQDPALLEYVGRGMFRSSVFPIPARGERTLTIRYAEVLKLEGGARKYSYSLSTGRFASRPAQVSSVNVRLKTTAPLKTVYSPSHDVSIRRQDDNHATASWESRGEFPDRDFTLYYATNGDDVGMTLLLNQPPARDGYFMLIASPRYSIAKDRILPKQIVFVLDRTGSMQPNGKMEQAKNALHFCLDNLNGQDRFTVITFNEGADSLSRGLIPASLENIKKAHKFVSDVDATGGTNINEALSSALTLLRDAEGSQKMMVFLTDGLPTVGETNVENILANVRKLNGTSRVASTANIGAADLKARIFAFGVGYDVNVPFLDRLSAENRGDADYVRPNESIEALVSAFFSKVTSPILTGLKLEFENAEVYDLYPKTLPDLFKGTQAVITGRFRGDPKGGVRLTGYAQDKPQTFRLPGAFDGGASHSGLVPRIWATRKIGYLLDQVRLSSNQEVVDEIIRLSKEYGIITPYTAYLADERQDQGITRQELGERIVSYQMDSAVQLRGVDEAKKELFALSRNREVSGEAETLRSLNTKGYQAAERAPAAGQSAGNGRASKPGALGGGLIGQGSGRGTGRAVGDRPGAGTEARKNLALDYNKADINALGGFAVNANEPGYKQVQATARVQNVAGRTFFKRGAVWFDNNYKAGRKVIQVKALSDAHFQLIDWLPNLTRYASVGDEVLIDVGKAAIQIGKEGKEKLTESELKEITGK